MQDKPEVMPHCIHHQQLSITEQGTMFGSTNSSAERILYETSSNSSHRLIPPFTSMEGSALETPKAPATRRQYLHCQESFMRQLLNAFGRIVLIVFIRHQLCQHIPWLNAHENHEWHLMLQKATEGFML